jgi:hypothetical protein
MNLSNAVDAAKSVEASDGIENDVLAQSIEAARKEREEAERRKQRYNAGMNQMMDGKYPAFV